MLPAGFGPASVPKTGIPVSLFKAIIKMRFRAKLLEKS